MRAGSASRAGRGGRVHAGVGAGRLPNGGDGGGGADGNADSAQAAPETVTSTVTTTAGGRHRRGSVGPVTVADARRYMTAGTETAMPGIEAGPGPWRRMRGRRKCPDHHRLHRRVEPPSAGDRWELTETNYDSCGELTYALFHQMPQGNSQFATKSSCSMTANTRRRQHRPAAGLIIGEGDGWFEVEYKDWEALMESGEATRLRRSTPPPSRSPERREEQGRPRRELPNQNLY